ncbi:hypothetical protein RA20_18780 [Leisingera sp. ANG-Vp]|nr:hypothetical protein RA20_18780 [Leisingera sp. ANG-Vp]
MKISGPTLAAAGAIFLAPCQAAAQDKNLTGMVGIGAVFSPDYPGSDNSSATPMPIVDLTWRDRFFLNQRGLGVYALRGQDTGGLSLGFALGYDFDERIAADDTRLTGLNDIEAGAMFTAFAEYELGVADLQFEVSRGLSSGGHEGTRATLGAEFSTMAGPRLQLSARPFMTWADGSYTEAFYGISVSEAAASGFSQYDTGSGLERVGIELQAAYALTDRTGLYLGVSHAQLMGDAKDSPVAFDDTQTSISTGVFFRF